MNTFYGHGSPNPHKVAIALEELGLPYEAKVVNTGDGEQFAADFVAMNPNSKVPVIVDHDAGLTIYESNAILQYLAEKAGRLMPTDPAERWEAMQLLFLQSASVGPMFGQRAWFAMFAPEKPASAVARYEKEGDRLESVLNGLLAGRDHFLRSGYSIVDIAVFGWMWCAVSQGYTVDDHPDLKAWFDRTATRPAVAEGVTIPMPLPDFTALRRG